MVLAQIPTATGRVYRYVHTDQCHSLQFPTLCKNILGSKLVPDFKVNKQSTRYKNVPDQNWSAFMYSLS